MPQKTSQKNIITVSGEIAGRTLTLEYGKVAGQASSAVMARYGDTMVLATAMMGRENAGLGYFPLSIEYVERLYASGKIKGSRWMKREGRPSDYAVLTARLIDRSVRPLFPNGLINEIQVIITELSYDEDNETDILGFVASSAALASSLIPWDGPVAATKVGKVNGEWVANPSEEQRKESELELVVSSSRDVVNMIEAGAKEIDDMEMVEAIEFAHKVNQEVLDLIEEFVSKMNPTKKPFSEPELDKELKKSAAGYIKENIKPTEEMRLSYDVVWEGFKEQYAEDEKVDMKALSAAFGKAWKEAIRAMIIKGTRPDGRKANELRNLSAEVGLLPRTHGSALFSRGMTQALTVATLASPSFALMIESTTEDLEKRYIHHYNFPPFSVGESGRMGSPNRREIGHGALAEKALVPVIPSLKDFPYTIRVVSDILSSNGSTSQASVSGSSLALMDAGVPISAHVAGVAMGLISDPANDPIILSDIAGIEDFNGDMDFKVAGTEKGVTAIQLDVKIPGLSLELVKQVMTQAREDRMQILKVMTDCIDKPRAEVSQFAPKIDTIEVPQDRIGEIIGPGGKMIRLIIAETGAEVDVDDSGVVTFTATDPAAVKKAKDWVKGLITDPEVGEEYDGTVVRMMPFGAFVEILPGKDGMVHVSKINYDYLQHPEEVLNIGDKVRVKVEEIDDLGRVNLTMLLNGPKESNNDRGGRDGGGTQGGGRGEYRSRGGGGGRRDDHRGGGGNRRGGGGRGR